MDALKAAPRARHDAELAAAQRALARAGGEELWALYEQVLVAALDAGPDAALATQCLGALEAEFPAESQRVGRLRGMLQEAEGEFKAADATYRELADANPSNALVAKRQVALLKARATGGAARDVVARLNEIVANFQGDQGVWWELADQHLRAGNFKAAAFCFEELVLFNPYSHVVHTRLAEAYYSVGDYADARKHFAQALDLFPSGARAAIGVMMCAGRSGSGSGSGGDGDWDARVAGVAVEKAVAAQCTEAQREMVRGLAA